MTWLPYISFSYAAKDRWCTISVQERYSPDIVNNKQQHTLQSSYSFSDTPEQWVCIIAEYQKQFIQDFLNHTRIKMTQGSHFLTITF